jgi:anti-sigma factor RsiW
MITASSPCPERELLLHGLADGELDAANALVIEEHLRGCGGCAASYDEIVRQKKLLASGGLRLQASSALRNRILSAIAENTSAETVEVMPRLDHARGRQRNSWRPWFPRAGIAFSAAALAASLMLFLSSWTGGPSIDDELIASHIRSLLASHLTDVASSDQHTVKPWFLGKLDFAPPVEDLASKDFPMIGGRLDYIGGRVVAAIVYKRRGHVINLFIWPADKGQGIPETQDGYHILSWSRGGFAYAAVSDLNVNELRDFQRALENSQA